MEEKMDCQTQVTEPTTSESVSKRKPSLMDKYESKGLLKRGRSKCSTTFPGKPGQPLTFPKIPAHKSVGMYIASVQNKKEAKAVPNYRGNLTYSISVDLIKSWRWREEQDKRLESERKVAIRKRDIMDQQWRSLSQMEDELSSAFRRYDGFVRENEDKRLRSQRRTAYFKQTSDFREEATNELREKYNEALRIKGMMEARIRRYSMYDEYLNSVVVISRNYFKHPQDFILRYEALLEAKTLINKKQEETYDELQEVTAKLRRMHEDSSMKIVGLMNNVNELMQRYEHAKVKALKCESIVYLVYDYTLQLKTRLIRTKESCLNVYKGCCRRQKVDHLVSDDNAQAQLLFIKRTLEELQHITHKFDVQKQFSTVL